MASRIELDEKLRTIVPNVYFQPPTNTMMRYPAIRYELSDVNTKHADNLPYSISLSYQLTLIDSNPDNEYVMKLANLPKCVFDRHFKSDNLNHYVFTINH